MRLTTIVLPSDVRSFLVGLSEKFIFHWRGEALSLLIFRRKFKTNKFLGAASGVKFSVSSPNSVVRVKQGHQKEPMTARWIDNMEPDSCFWDVGANIGLFSIRAGARGIRVLAIEPLLENVVDFQRTLDINPQIAEKVSLFYGGIYNSDGMFFLSISSPKAGMSGSQFGKDYDQLGAPRLAPIHRAVVGSTGATLHRLVNRGQGSDCAPNYIKIDVDGQELACLEGLRGFFSLGTVRSVLVETGPSIWGNTQEIRAFFQQVGFHEVSSEPTTESGVWQNLIFEQVV